MAKIRDVKTGRFLATPPLLCMDCQNPRSRALSSKRCRSCSSKLTAKNLGKYATKGFLIGEKNYKWKGDKVGYYSLHNWLKRELGKPMFCAKNMSHVAPLYHWANISGEYLRDLSDWHSLCPSCNKTDGVKKADRFTLERMVI